MVMKYFSMISHKEHKEREDHKEEGRGVFVHYTIVKPKLRFRTTLFFVIFM
jgi:hypothetical protein